MNSVTPFLCGPCDWCDWCDRCDWCDWCGWSQAASLVRFESVHFDAGDLHPRGRPDREGIFWNTKIFWDHPQGIPVRLCQSESLQTEPSSILLENISAAWTFVKFCRTTRLLPERPIRILHYYNCIMFVCHHSVILYYYIILYHTLILWYCGTIILSSSYYDTCILYITVTLLYYHTVSVKTNDMCPLGCPARLSFCLYCSNIELTQICPLGYRAGVAFLPKAISTNRSSLAAWILSLAGGLELFFY